MIAWLFLFPLVLVPVSASKLGPHLIGDYTEGARQIITAGPRVIKVLDPQANGRMLEAVRDYKHYHPDGVVVMRVWERTPEVRFQLGDDAAASAERFWQFVLAPALERLTAEDRRLIDYLEGPNECENIPGWGSVEEAAWFGRFWVRLAERMATQGLRPCAGSIPVGNPPGTPDEVRAKIEAFVPALQAVHRLGGVWSYHAYSLEYSTDPEVESWYSLRYRRFYQHLRERHPELANLPLILSEGGIDKGGNPREDGWRARGDAAKYQAWLRWFDRELRKDRYVLGVTLFQIGDPQGWWSFDLEPVAGWLAKHLQAHARGG